MLHQVRSRLAKREGWVVKTYQYTDAEGADHIVEATAFTVTTSGALLFTESDLEDDQWIWTLAIADGEWTKCNEYVSIGFTMET
jgi:hypothetical protein